MGNWSENYQSWKAFIKHNKYLLIKYEDFIAHREETFLKILKFIYSLRNINFSIDTNKLKNVIKTTSLDNLKKLEQKDTFGESAKDSYGNKINFFDKGGKRDWSKELSQDMKVQLEKALNKEMIELGYL
jgi:predicted RNA-binding protein